MINSTAYYNDFWNEMRGTQEVLDRLRDGRESKTNAYHLPGESNKKYAAALQKESVVRQLATVVNATRSDSRLWTFDCEGQAELKYRHTEYPSLSDLAWSLLLTSPLPLRIM